MSSQFVTYSLIATAACAVALIVIKPRNAMDLSRCAGWYLLVFFATYVVRPATAQMTGDLMMYNLLKIGRFEDHWQLMAIAVPLAILCFAIAYWAEGPSRERPARPDAQKQPVLNADNVRMLCYCLMVWGYFAAAVSIKTGTLMGGAGDYEGAAVGVYEHNTAWFAQDDLLVSTGGILYYMLTGRLGMALLLTSPWIIMRVLVGFGRTHLLGYFFALMAVHFLKTRRSEKSGKKSRQTFVLGIGVLVILMLFPFLVMLRGLKGRLHMSAAGMSKDAFYIMRSGANPQDMLQTYLGTNSSITGFETTLDHLLNDKRSELGTQYLFYYFIKPVPRIIWPGKGSPYTWPEKLRGVEADPLLALIGAAPGSIGMAFQQWGWLGIPFEFLFTGWLIRRSEEAVRRRPDALHINLAYAGLYSMLPQLGRDSMLFLIANLWLFKFGLPVFILWRMYATALERDRLRGARLARPAMTAVLTPEPGA